MHASSERATDEAAARTPPSRSEGQTLTIVHCVFVSGFTTLFLAARVAALLPQLLFLAAVRTKPPLGKPRDACSADATDLQCGCKCKPA